MFLTRYLKSSSIHGFRYLSGGHWFGRCVWSCCILVSFGLAGVVIKMNVDIWRNQPSVITNVDYQLVESLPNLMPSILVCPRAPDAIAVLHSFLTQHPQFISDGDYKDAAHMLVTKCVRSTYIGRFRRTNKQGETDKVLECIDGDSEGCKLIRALESVRVGLNQDYTLIFEALTEYITRIELGNLEPNLETFSEFMLQYSNVNVTYNPTNFTSTEALYLMQYYAHFQPLYKDVDEEDVLLELRSLDEYPKGTCQPPTKEHLGHILAYMVDQGLMVADDTSIHTRSQVSVQRIVASKVFMSALARYLEVEDQMDAVRLINMLSTDEDQRLFATKADFPYPCNVSQSTDMHTSCKATLPDKSDFCYEYCRLFQLLTANRKRKLIDLLWSGYDGGSGLPIEGRPANLLPNCRWRGRDSGWQIADEGCWEQVVNELGVCYVNNRGSSVPVTTLSYSLDLGAPFDLAGVGESLDFVPVGWSAGTFSAFNTVRSVNRKVDILMMQRGHISGRDKMHESRSVNPYSDWIFSYRPKENEVNSERPFRAFYSDVQVNSVVRVTDELIGVAPETRQCHTADEVELEFFREYSEGNCMLECAWKEAADRCGCVPWTLSRHLPEFDTCEHFGNSCFKDLVDNRYTNGVCGEEESECLPDCERVIFKANFERAPQSRLSNDWISALPKSLINENVAARTQSVAGYNGTTFAGNKDAYLAHRANNNLRNKMAVVVVTMQDEQVLTIVKTATMTLVDMVCNVGGALGLFCGFSTLSLVEMIYWAAKGLSSKMKRKKANGDLKMC